MAKEKIQEQSLAMDILKSFKNQNRVLFIANIMLVIALIIAIIF